VVYLPAPLLLQCYKSLHKWAGCRAAALQLLEISPSDSIAQACLNEANSHIPQQKVSTNDVDENSAPLDNNVTSPQGVKANESTADDADGSVSDQLKALAAMMSQTSISE